MKMANTGRTRNPSLGYSADGRGEKKGERIVYKYLHEGRPAICVFSVQQLYNCAVNGDVGDGTVATMSFRLLRFCSKCCTVLFILQKIISHNNINDES